MEKLSVVPLAIVLVASLIAAVTDVWKFKVYNILTVPVLISGLLFQGVFGGWAGLTQGLMGVLFGLFALIPFYVMGGMGAGDVKLMAAVGAWLGMPLTFHIFIASSLTAGVYALFLLVFRGGLGEAWVNLQIIWFRLATFSRHLGSDNRLELEATRPDRRKRFVPFAAMIAMGTILTFIWMFFHGTVKIYN